MQLAITWEGKQALAAEEAVLPAKALCQLCPSASSSLQPLPRWQSWSLAGPVSNIFIDLMTDASASGRP